MKTKFTPGGLLAVLMPVMLATPVFAIDLLQQYPTSLTAGDDNGSHARAWEFSAADIYQVARFELKVGDGFKVATGAADLGIGHCADGAVWAVVIPHEPGTLTSTASKEPEGVAHVWLRFHPGQIDKVFPPETVLAAGNLNLTNVIRHIANGKIHTSWQAGGKAMIPEPKDLTVYPDTKAGAHRFFIVDTAAQTAEYVAAFDAESATSSMTWESAPPVVIRTVPEAGANNVPPGPTEIRVTFSKEMTDGSWSWCDAWENSTPADGEKPKYEADHITCVCKVKLEPGKTYGYWLNTKSYRNFKDKDGHPAVPYLLTFKTATNGQSGQPAPKTGGGQ